MPNSAEYKMEENLVLDDSQVGPTFFETYCARFGNSESVGLPSVPIEQLSAKQRLICQTVQEHIAKPLGVQLSKPLRAIVIGQAGWY